MSQIVIDSCYDNIIESINKKVWPTDFHPDPSPWFAGQDERCVEIPWALSRYRGQKKVLEIGLALADPMLVRAQAALKMSSGCDLYALDIVDINRVRNRFQQLDIDISQIYDFHQGDARQTDFEGDCFNLIFLVSTLEHFGFDEFEPDKFAETVFKRPDKKPESFPEYTSCRDDRKALAEIKRILAPGGSLLLTVPFGNREICMLKDSKGLWALYKEYTLDEWGILLESSGLEVIDERFYYNRGKHGWCEESTPENLLQQSYAKHDVVNNVACVELKKG